MNAKLSTELTLKYISGIFLTFENFDLKKYFDSLLKFGTGKSLSEALILVSTNAQYDKILFIELRVQYLKVPSSEHVENMLCTQIGFCFDIQNNLCTQHVLSL
jgi:hypothetical protein